MVVATNCVKAMENTGRKSHGGGYLAAVWIMCAAPATFDRHNEEYLVENYTEGQMYESDHGIT